MCGPSGGSPAELAPAPNFASSPVAPAESEPLHPRPSPAARPGTVRPARKPAPPGRSAASGGAAEWQGAVAAAASTFLAGAEENPQTAPGPQALDDWHEESASHLVSDPTAPSLRGRDRSLHGAALLAETAGRGEGAAVVGWWSCRCRAGSICRPGPGTAGGGAYRTRATRCGGSHSRASVRAGSLCPCLCRGLSVQR